MLDFNPFKYIFFLTVKKLIKSSGFEFLREKVDHEAKYCQNPKSMLQYSYNCIFFTCVKQEA